MGGRFQRMKFKVLIVEDSKASRELIAATVESIPGLEAIATSSGFEALKLLPRHRFDLIITDINMPDINGLELINFVKKNPNYRDTPLFIVTTEGREKDRDRGLALGAAEYLVKPFSPAEPGRARAPLPEARVNQAGKALAEFVAEATEILEALGKDLLVLDQQRGTGARPGAHQRHLPRRALAQGPLRALRAGAHREAGAPGRGPAGPAAAGQAARWTTRCSTRSSRRWTCSRPCWPRRRARSPRTPCPDA